MFPIALNLAIIPVLLIGRGEALEKRKRQLEEAGAVRLTLMYFPMQENMDHLIAAHKIIFIAGLPYEESKPIADAARTLGKLVNAEDINDLCDFYFTANVKRGDLLIAVSTGGASPTLAKRVRDKIAGLFADEWDGRVEAIASARRAWKADGKSMQEVARLTDEMLAEKGWLS